MAAYQGVKTRKPYILRDRKNLRERKEPTYREEINERMTKMFSLLKEYTKGKSSKMVLVREESSKPIIKYVNTISLIKKEGEEVEEFDEVIVIEVVEQSQVLGDDGIEKDEGVDENE
ncbi:hypothetical protein Tco_0563863 [Tanacetum coccineum]